MAIRLLIGLFILPTFSFAGLKYHSENLALMDIESIERVVDKNIAEAQRSGGGAADEDENNSFADSSGGGGDPKALLKSSLELVLARPEQNASTSLVFSKIETSSDLGGGIETLLSEITDDALRVLDEDGNEKELLRSQNTYVYILNAMLAEIKPKVRDGEPKMREIVERIRDANISFSDAFKSHRLLNSMKNVDNPSKVATEIVGKKKCSWWEFWC